MFLIIEIGSITIDKENKVRNIRYTRFMLLNIVNVMEW